MKKCWIHVGFLLALSNSLVAQEIKNFFLPECNQDIDLGKAINRISYQTFENDVLSISFSLVSNCAGVFNPTIKYNSDTLEVKYEDYKTEYDTVATYDSIVNASATLEINEIHATTSMLACDCYFELELEITGLLKNPAIVILNNNIIEYYPEKYKLVLIKFDIVDGDTINYSDKFGYRQGIWIARDSTNQLMLERFYKNDIIIKGTDFRYYENGTIKNQLEWINNKHANYYEFDSDGNITVHKKSVWD